ncbi:MAG: toxin [Candidatus Omnitrophica bacterium]|jgi:hypothetical protein|nr:toxin [Candidatus Omnitrophota bacterium]
MEAIRWNVTKSARLKRIRGVSFEEIVKAKFLDVLQHPSRNNQGILIYEHNGYVWAAPFVADAEGIFLKTLYPCRKYKKIYKKEVII